MKALDIEALADDAWLLRLDDRLGEGLNARVHALAARIAANAPDWLRDVVPAYASLAVFFEPRLVPASQVHAWLRRLVAVAGDDPPATAGRRVEIPMVYGGEYGPDLAAAADDLGIEPEQLASRHASGDYTVAMIGFAPGFPYLFGLDPALALPRLATPRVRVPAGSVGVAGGQTGIYPRDSPGGWRLLGRTPLRLFDPGSTPPSALQPGDRVRFVAIDAAAYAALAEQKR